MANTNRAKKQRRQQRQLEMQKKKKIRQLMAVTIGVVIVVFGALFIFYEMKQGATTPTSASTETVQASAFQYDKHPALGDKQAPIKIVEFADFKCPICKQFDETILPQIKKDFINTGTVQYYFINDPIISPNADSTTAALAGEAIYHQNPDDFWKFYDAAYQQQGDENTQWATADKLVQIAKLVDPKIDDQKLKKDIDQKTYMADVKNDEAIVSQLGVNGTPTLYINGQQVSVQDTFNYSALKQDILKAKGASGK